MPTVRENIIAAIDAALVGLDIGSPGIVQAVYQDWTPPEAEAELPCIYLLDPEEAPIRTGDEGAPMGSYDKTLEVHTIACFVGGSQHRDETPGQTAREVLGKIERKIYVESKPGTGSIKLVPGVIWVKERTNRTIPFGEGSGVIQVDIEWNVKYRHDDQDPEVAA